MFRIFVFMAALWGSVAASDVIDDWQSDPAQFFEAADVPPAALIWQARALVIFANTPLDPNFQRQVELITADIERVIERDVILITDTDPEARSDWRQKLRPNGFGWVLLGKNGDVVLRKPFPWDMRELSRSIDKMPLRQQELRQN